MNVRLVRAGLWTLGFGCLWLPLFDDPPLHSGAYVQDVGTDRAVIAQVTATAVHRSLVVTDEHGTAIPVAAEAAPGRRHQFALTGLGPAQRYRYRLLDENGGDCDGGDFRTAPASDAAPVHFAVLGDSGDQPWWVWLQRSPLFWLPACWDWLPPSAMVAQIGARIAAAEPDFVLHVGDIVYPWGHQGHYAPGFFRPFAEALRHAPFYATLGNHDVLDDDGRQALANLVLPRGELTGDERCYSFAWGAVRVIVLDFGLQREDDRVGPDHPSRRFLQQQLEICTEPWLVVTSHYPIHSASRQRDRADLAAEILPLLEEHAVDLYLCGHDHTYQRFGSGGADTVVQVVSGGGGKSLYELHQDRRAKVVQSQFHWCAVEVAGRTLVLRAHGVDGALIDTVDLRLERTGARAERIRRLHPARAARIDTLPD